MKRLSLNLYHKFALIIICVGLIPMLVLSTFIFNHMMRAYGDSLKSNYEQAAYYVISSIENMLDSYNDISKMPYYYNYSSDKNLQFDYLSYDNLRQIVQGTGYAGEEMEKERAADMTAFLRSVQRIDGYIIGTYFAAQDEAGKNGIKIYQYSARHTYFKDEDRFREGLNIDNWDRATKKLVLLPCHSSDYYHGSTDQVFSIGRNYFDLRKEVGQTPYIGTLFMDIETQKLSSIFKSVKLSENDRFYLVNEEGVCFYSNSVEAIGEDAEALELSKEESNRSFIIDTPYNKFGLKLCVVVDIETAYGSIRQTRNMMYLFLGLSIIALLLGSVLFSKELTKPIRNMMSQMSQIESGNFDIHLPINSNDEIGILSQRFNRMSGELKNYINQSYGAKIKQTEAELTALKSQIYPHFLYNTLEIIRMTALENEDEKVSEMIEALSIQIHYIIGPMRDMVPLEKEIDIVRKYVYLLNCRITGKVNLIVMAENTSAITVPKLILQPIVENAYVHGLRPRNGSGSISIELEINQKEMVISVMDNGIGMDETALNKLTAFLKSDEIGIKNEHNWQSIGMKNVHDRIRYLYGEDYGIKTTSTPSVGTIVQIVMPVNEGGGIDGHDKNDIGG